MEVGRGWIVIAFVPLAILLVMILAQELSAAFG